MYGYGGFPPYVSVAEKKQKAQRSLKKLQKQNPNIRPVIIESAKIANSWWGISWCKNLERYADYLNRISRGKSYAKVGYIFDLQIEPGKITAIVGGSRSKPYNIEIKIDQLADEKWHSISERCSRQIDSITDLIAGKFPKELAGIFTEKGSGLFPSPKEIHFDCDCPDWADMCKHIASVLYGIGNRLDDDPLLFFAMRGLDMEALIKKSIEEKTKSMLANASVTSSRVMEDVDIEDLFGL